MNSGVSFADLSSEEGSSSEITAPSCGTAVQSKSLIPASRNKIKSSPPPSVFIESEDNDEIDDNDHNVNNHDDSDDDMNNPDDTDAETEEPLIENGQLMVKKK
jgi:hypothetical protein